MSMSVCDRQKVSVIDTHRHTVVKGEFRNTETEIFEKKISGHMITKDNVIKKLDLFNTDLSGCV